MTRCVCHGCGLHFILLAPESVTVGCPSCRSEFIERLEAPDEQQAALPRVRELIFGSGIEVLNLHASFENLHTSFEELFGRLLQQAGM